MQKPLAYIHIPKTGGTYIGQLEARDVPVISPIKYLGHIAVVEKEDQPNYLYYPRDPENSYRTILRKDLEQYFVFSTVRNLFSWLVSYAGHAGAWPSKYVSKEHYDYENAQKGFEYLVKTIANRETPWPNRKFIFSQLFSSQGELIVDWVTRTESLDENLQTLSEYTDVTYQKKIKQRLGQHNDYRTYYNTELIDLVYKVWKRELNLFGYAFDSYVEESALLKTFISKDIKDRITYIYTSDYLAFKEPVTG